MAVIEQELLGLSASAWIVVHDQDAVHGTSLLEPATGVPIPSTREWVNRSWRAEEPGT